MPKRTRAQRERRGASDEVVRVLANAFGFESADDYGCANEAALPRLRARYARTARRARALTKVSAFVARHTDSPAPLRRSSRSNEQQAQEQQAQAFELLLWADAGTSTRTGRGTSTTGVARGRATGSARARGCSYFATKE